MRATMVQFGLHCIVVGCNKLVRLGPQFSVCFRLDTCWNLKDNQIFTCIKPISGERRYLSSRVLISHSTQVMSGLSKQSVAYLSLLERSKLLLCIVVGWIKMVRLGAFFYCCPTTLRSNGGNRYTV